MSGGILWAEENRRRQSTVAW